MPEKGNFAYIAIVAIVAIVAIIVMIQEAKQEAKIEKISFEENLMGAARDIEGVQFIQRQCVWDSSDDGRWCHWCRDCTTNDYGTDCANWGDWYYVYCVGDKK